MKKVLFPILNALLTLFNVASGQGDGAVFDSTGTVDLTVRVLVDSVSDNAIIPTSDSVFSIWLYEGTVGGNDAFDSSTQLYDKSKACLTAEFDSLPRAEYSVRISFPLYDIEKDMVDIFDLKSDSTITVYIEPSTKYRIMVSADPPKYSIYFGYLEYEWQSEPSEYSFVGEPNNCSIPGGSIEFTVLSLKRWMLKLKLEDRDDGEFAKIDKKFQRSSFAAKNPFKTRYEPPFEWIMVEMEKMGSGKD